MPKPSTKSTKSNKTTSVVAVSVEALPTIKQEAQPSALHREPTYPKLTIIEYSSTSEDGPMTPEDMKKLMRWETESEFQARMVAEKGGEPQHWLYGEEFHCYNLNVSKAKPRGEKVRCWSNTNNRPFDMEWCNEIKDMILRGQYVGPLTVPGETVNGETIRIGRYANMLSGQHQGTALILAYEALMNSRNKDHKDGMYYDPNDPESEKYPFWKGHDYPVIETIVVYGLSEDERVLRSIDYVKPRSVADMLFTMELFRDSTSVDRKELTRMLASGIDLLWTRTGTKGYRTHPEIVGFLERHKTLMKFVQHLFVLNRSTSSASDKWLEGETEVERNERLELDKKLGGRKISKLYLSAGQCAAMCFLMGCSKTPAHISDTDYRNGKPAPSEKCLDWSMTDRAKLFWINLASHESFELVREQLRRLKTTKADDEDNQGLGGRFTEKLAVIAKAWAVFKDHPESAGDPFHEDDLIPPDGALSLSYSDLDEKGNKLPKGEVELVDVAEFFGIDVPTAPKKKTKESTNGTPDSPPPEPQELDDGSPMYTWVYKQRIGEYGVEVELVTR